MSTYKDLIVASLVSRRGLDEQIVDNVPVEDHDYCFGSYYYSRADCIKHILLDIYIYMPLKISFCKKFNIYTQSRIFV